MASSALDKTIFFFTRALYPNWLSVSFFTEGWDFFFQQEVYSLSVWFSIVLLWQIFVSEFCFVNLILSWALVIFLRRIVVGGICTSTKNLSGQTAIVTGSNTGIGKETARGLLQRGARVILACRTPSKAEDARRELAREGGTIETRQLDLSSLQSVRDFAEGIKKDNIRVHILVNNAGVAFVPYTETCDGFELIMATNHLNHFLLTNLLLPQMKHEEPARIVNVSSLGHTTGEMDFDDFFNKKNYDRIQVYANSKLANVLFTRQLAKKLKGTNIQVFAPHPGAVQSELVRDWLPKILNDNVWPLFLKTTMEGAQTSLYCCTDAVQDPCMYFSDCSVGWPIPLAKNDLVAEKLWEVSAKLVGLKE